MRILDRYIVRTFLVSVGMWFAVMYLLRLAIDLFINMDEYIDKTDSLAEAMRVVVDYYAYQSFLYFNEMGAVIILFGAVTTLYMMNRSNELVAILASGVSLHRVIFPVVICAMLLGGVIVLNQELLVPRFAQKLARGQGDVTEWRGFQLRLISDSRGTVWWSPVYDPTIRTMTRPEVLLRRSDLSLLARAAGVRAKAARLGDRTGWQFENGWMCRAPEAQMAWDNIQDDRRIFSVVSPDVLLRAAREKTLRLTGQDIDISGRVRIPKVWACDPAYGMVIEAEPFVAGPGVAVEVPEEGTVRTGRLVQPTFTFWSRLAPAGDGSGELVPAPDAQLLGVFRANAARWRPRRTADDPDGHWELEGGSLFCPSDLTPRDLILRQSSRWLEYMSARDLRDLIARRRLPDPSEAQMAIHARATQPIVSVVMLLLALPFILSRERNIKASAGLCLLVVLVFYGFVFACRYVGLPPVWAAWLPILVFGPVAAVMVDSVKT